MEQIWIILIIVVIIACVGLVFCWIAYKNSFEYFLIHVKCIEVSKGRNGHRYYVRGSKRHTKKTMEKFHYNEYIEWKNKK